MATISLGATLASSSNTSSYALTAFTPAAGDLIVVFVSATGTVNTTILGGTLTDTQSLGWTNLSYGPHNGTADTNSCFVANNLAAASSLTITWDCTGDNATGAVITAFRIAGAAGAGPGTVRQVGRANGAAASTPTVVMPQAILTGNPVVGIGTNGGAINTLTQPTGFTEFTETAYTTPAGNIEPIYANSGITASTVTWGATSATAWGAIVVELYNAGTGPLPNTYEGGYYGSICSI